MQVCAKQAVRIDCREVSLTLGFSDLLHSVSFSVFPGECLGLLGPSGAGKSTLLKTINGYLSPTSGQVLYNRQDLSEVYEDLKTAIGYVPQDDLVHPSLTPRQELYFAARLRLPGNGSEDYYNRRIERVIDLMGIREQADTKIRRLSGGQRKRVSMGVELLSEPPVLFLDEPTSGLDPALEEKMMRLFRRLARDGRSVVITTHIMETLDALDLVLVLHKGRMIYFGRPADAAAYFRVSTFTDIYKRIESKSPAEWQALYRSSPLYGRFIRERFSRGPQPGAGAADTGAAGAGTADTGTADTGAADTGAADTGAANGADANAEIDRELEELKEELGL